MLLVDDEPALRASWTRKLEALGYQVTAAGDPLAALAAFEREPDRFAVVLTDLTMPHLSGVELGRRLLELRPGLPIVLVSGHGEGWTREQLRTLGIAAWLPKPLDEVAVAVALRDGLAAGGPRP